jgi:exopolysaccharide biosynthesis polyprenyl glycosylphosphotransferase
VTVYSAKNSERVASRPGSGRPALTGGSWRRPAGLHRLGDRVSSRAHPLVMAKVSGLATETPLGWAAAAADLGLLGLVVLRIGVPAGSACVLVAVVMATLAVSRDYRSRLTLSVLDELPTLAKAALLGALSAFALPRLTATEPTTSGAESPMVMGVVTVGTLLLSRVVVFGIARQMRARMVINYPTLVAGADETGTLVMDILLHHPEYGLRPVALWESSLSGRGETSGTAVLPLTPLKDALAATKARVLIVAHGGYSDTQIVHMLRTCERMHCDVFLLPRLHQMAVRTNEMEEIWGLPLMRLRRPAHEAAGWFLKRVLDVVVAATLLLLLIPVFVVVALLVRHEGGPGVLFRQQRVGRDGRPFELMKFRSLTPVDEAESATMWNIAEDARVGPVGRFLRRTSLDELPQLWNVLRGDMSLVGPRPERPHYVDQFTSMFPQYMYRHRVPSGMTGWAQVHGLRGNTSIEERSHFDNYYIENWSMWLDLKILLRTIAVVIQRDGG